MEDNKKTKLTFEFNEHFFRMGLYIVLIVAASAIIIRLTFDWGNMAKLFSSIYKIISPFILGVFIAFVLNPLVLLFKKRLFQKTFHIKKEKPALYLSIFITYVLLIGLIILLFIFIVPQIYNSIIDLTSQINTLYINTSNILNSFQSEHTDLTFIDYSKIMDTLNNAVPQIIDYLTNITGNIIPFLYSTASSFVRGIYNLIIAVIISIYIISDQKQLIINIKKLIYAILPDKNRNTIVEVLRESIRIFGDFVWGKAVDSIIIGLINFIVMSILNLRFAVLISVIVGITNMIPYFGPFIGGAIGAVILLITSPVNSFIFIIVILILQQFDGIILGPKILGDSIGIKPLWVIFGITVGGSLGGIIGMFLGVPCVAVLSYILDMFITAKLHEKNLSLVDGTIKPINNAKK